MKKIIVSVFLIGFLVSCSDESNDTSENLDVGGESSASLSPENSVLVSGVKLPLQLNFGEEMRNYVGAGTRIKFFMHIYVLGLYMKEPSQNPDVILNSDQPMSVRLHIISSMLTTEVMVKYIREGFTRAAGGNIKSIENKINMICETFSSVEENSVGDIVDIHYTPGVGITASKNLVPYDFSTCSNGESVDFAYTDDGQAALTGMEFKKALFGIWLSDDPVDEDLKRKVLGIE